MPGRRQVVRGKLAARPQLVYVIDQFQAARLARGASRVHKLSAMMATVESCPATAGRLCAQHGAYLHSVSRQVCRLWDSFTPTDVQMSLDGRQKHLCTQTGVAGTVRAWEIKSHPSGAITAA